MGTLQRQASARARQSGTSRRRWRSSSRWSLVLWIEPACDELRRIGLRRAAVSDGLTPAQTRMAELVAAGLSNQEIASTLYMSTRTVESHPTKIYRSYGVRSRAQLVGALVKKGGDEEHDDLSAAFSSA
jgi:DNA-binding CsgD family transcriptional regulator